jgi:hypothetical protein
MPLSEKTIPYKTFIKQSLVEALHKVFDDHVDDLLKKTKVTIEYPTSEAAYPAIIIRFFERDIKNAGVGHSEILSIDNVHWKFKHYLYSGDIEFSIHALSSLDRDLIADSLIQTLGMGDLTSYTEPFFKRIYNSNATHPKALFNFINLNTDTISGFGETQNKAPWDPEDVYVYQTNYRCGIYGEFYSLPPAPGQEVGFVEEVDQYPYLQDLEDVPNPHPEDPAEWQPPFD